MSDVVEEILTLHRKGARVLFAHGHSGRQKVKVQYGFMHLKTKRFDVDSRTMTEIKDRIAGLRS